MQCTSEQRTYQTAWKHWSAPPRLLNLWVVCGLTSGTLQLCCAARDIQEEPPTLEVVLPTLVGSTASHTGRGREQSERSTQIKQVQVTVTTQERYAFTKIESIARSLHLVAVQASGVGDDRERHFCCMCLHHSAWL